MTTRSIAYLSCVAALALSGCGSTERLAYGVDPALAVPPLSMPTEIRLRLTDEGPVFTDARGMTLYWSTLDDETPGTSHCNADYAPPAENHHALLKTYAQSFKPPPCTSQWPPAQASKSAQAVGDWTIITRTDGTRQWAYKNHPVHTSYKDMQPGDVNGAVNNRLGSIEIEYQAAFAGTTRWYVESAPMIAPPGVKAANRQDLGVVAVTAKGPLYTLKAKDGACDRECLRDWEPYTAGQTAGSIGYWDIVTRDDGTLQWTYEGQPVYRFKADDTEMSARGIETGTPVELLHRRPTPPSMRTGFTGVGEVFTNEQGKTLYVFLCDIRAPGTEQVTQQRHICNGWSDDPAFIEQFCAAKDRCGERWQPNVAPADTPALAGTWSIAVIPDPVKYPLRWVPVGHPAAKTPGAVKVWTNRGRPTYTFVDDTFVADFRGHHIYNASGARWIALLAGTYER